MITPELVSLNIISEDWGESSNDFWVMLHANIGEKGEEGADLFTLYVTSPQRLNKIVSHEGLQIGRGLLIMDDFNLNSVKQQIIKILLSCVRETWEEVGNVINRYFYWEYEDYQE